MLRPGLVEEAGRAAGQGGQAGVGRGPRVEEPGDRPGAAVVEAGPDGHPLALLRSRVGEQNHARLPVPVPAETPQAGLADGIDELRNDLLLRPGQAAVAADGGLRAFRDGS